MAVSRPQRPVPRCARWLWRLAGPHLGVPALAGAWLRLTNAWRGSPDLPAPWGEGGSLRMEGGEASRETKRGIRTDKAKREGSELNKIG